jgi:hypothetical protein
VEAGVSVAGMTRNGTEVFIRKNVSTTMESKPVTKQVCEPEYDYDEKRYTTKCHFKTVYERQPVTTTTYVVSGALSSSQRNVAGAFAQASAIGAMRFRRT